MKVFFDNCTSPVLASTLGGFLDHLGHSATHIKDAKCGRSATDIEWIEMLANDNSVWIVITGDTRIRKNKPERTAFRQSGLIGFVLSPAYQKTPMNKVASYLLWRWPDIERLTGIVGGGSLHELPMNFKGKIKQMPL
ncbi:hypothetical protein [Parvibaculum sp.]|uniref:PIN-like domain-containing protein n=1 Tax=Parvibaculum TaxID=256616 RepID=UPI000C958C1D|nr:hypothetical protein [Parvibaculum sp.]MAB13315.1 hypothetical protein [Parvibaculum sp.]